MSRFPLPSRDNVIDYVYLLIITVMVCAFIALIASHDGADRELFDKVCAKEFARPITVKFMGESPRRRHVAATLCCGIRSPRFGIYGAQGPEDVGAASTEVHLLCFDSAQRLQEAPWAYDLGEKK